MGIHKSLKATGSIVAAAALYFSVACTQQKSSESLPARALDESRHDNKATAAQAPERIPTAINSQDGVTNGKSRERRSAKLGDARGLESGDSSAKTDPIDKIFAVTDTVVKSADDVAQQALALSPEECKQVGKRASEMILAKVKTADLPDELSRLNSLLQPLLKANNIDAREIHTAIIRSDELNAFSHVGGYIYLNSHLLNFVRSDDELRFVLGHELGHIQLGHCARRVTYAARAENIVGDSGQLAQIAYNLASVGYSKEDEFEADAWAARNMRHLGYSVDAGCAVLQRLNDTFERQTTGNLAHNADASTKSSMQAVENHFRSHPPTNDRIARLRKVKQ